MKLRLNKKSKDEKKNNKKINKEKSPKKSSSLYEVRINITNYFLKIYRILNLQKKKKI